jgi:IS30 family transposase
MKHIKYKHLSFEDRCTIQEYLNYNYNFTQIANRIGKNRRTISKEIYKHRFKRNNTKPGSKNCYIFDKPPYVCNGCKNKNNCSKQRYSYEASIAHNEYLKTLVDQRSRVRITKEQVSSINDIISPLMIHKHHSVNQVYITHPEILPFSKSTFYRYIDLGLLNIKNIDLQRKVRFKVKKEYDRTKTRVDTSIKVNRFYTDFKDYIEFNPNVSIVEMDTVIGTSGGKGGKCFLTLLFRQFNFMLIYLLPYKRSEYVTEVFYNLKQILGIDEFKRLFEVILTDNGTEFSDPLSIEIDVNTGEKLCSVFYCDPNCSWQKGSIEKNHEYIRYILPKGTSFAGLTQEDCNLIASHINSVPRKSLNNVSPFEYAENFIGNENIKKLNITKIDYDDIELSHRLLKK